MGKRSILIFLALLLLAGCSGCDARQASAPEADIYCPWNYNVVEQATADGMLHYYFMSSEGEIRDEQGELTKWGDCCLIAFPDGQTMLIDCGVTAYGTILMENLRRMGITRLDYIVITHPHSDHQNGIFHPDNLTGGVLDQVQVGQVYHRGGPDPKREDDGYVEAACTQRGIPLTTLEMGDSLQIGAVTAQVLWPKPGTSGKEITGTANVNNSSLVIRFDYREHSALFTGDLYDDGEFSLLSSQDTKIFDVDLMKAPHHGGYTSGCEVFLGVVSPELAVATGYEPIRDDVAARYRKAEIKLLDDRTYGYIHVSTDGATMTEETSRNQAQ